MPVQNVKSRQRNLNFDHKELELRYLPQSFKALGCSFVALSESYLFQEGNC